MLYINTNIKIHPYIIYYTDTIRYRSKSGPNGCNCGGGGWLTAAIRVTENKRKVAMVCLHIMARLEALTTKWYISWPTPSPPPSSQIQNLPFVSICMYTSTILKLKSVLTPSPPPSSQIQNLPFVTIYVCIRQL